MLAIDTPLTTLISEIKSKVPDVQVYEDEPKDPEGTWYVDIERGENSAVVQWRKRSGFGVSYGNNHFYGEGPEIVFDDLDGAIASLSSYFESSFSSKQKNDYPKLQDVANLENANCPSEQNDCRNLLQFFESCLSRRKTRSLADIFEGIVLRWLQARHSQELQVNLKQGDATSPQQVCVVLIVVKTPDIERSARFYSALGLQLHKHSHGQGPLHYTYEDSGHAFEIYPSQKHESTAPYVRIGFSVPSVDDLMTRAVQAGGTVKCLPMNSEWGRRAIIEDPDGHIVELTTSSG